MFRIALWHRGLLRSLGKINEMATASFDKTFVVSDTASIDQIRRDLSHPHFVVVQVRNYKAESEKGIKILRQRLSNSAAS